MARNKVIESKQAVINIALELLDREGINALSIRRIANKMKVSSMTLYNYIDNIDDIKKELVIEGFHRLYEKTYEGLFQISRAGESISIQKSYKVLARVLFDFGRSNRGLYILMFSSSHNKIRTDAEIAPFEGYFPKLLGKDDEIHKAMKMLDFITNSMIMEMVYDIHDYTQEEFEEYIDEYVSKMF